MLGRETTRPGSHGEAGAVAAEAAVVVPVLALVTVGLAWLVTLGVSHGRVVDAAREAARVVARGESAATGAALARRVGPAGTRAVVSGDGGTVVVTVTAPVRAPGGIFGFLPPVDLHAQAVSFREPSR
jgi:hypothetical protein